MTAKALKLIKKCQETKFAILDLRDCNLTDKDFATGSPLVAELIKCIHLKVLDFSRNQITTIIDDLKNLPQLKKLSLKGNKIARICNLGNLTNLIELDLGDNQISSIEGLDQLTQLRVLFLHNNQIKIIKGLEKLTQLRELYLNKNRITVIRGLESLIQLQLLYLNRNQIKVLKGIEKLVQLKIVNVSYNKISNIKSLIPLLKKEKIHLKVVLGDSRVMEINQINVEGNPLIIPPTEILVRGNNAIINYFKELDKRGVEYLYEAKMLIVGQPRAGKTSLRYKLFDSAIELPAEDQTTRGIDIDRLDFDLIDVEGNHRKFYYNIWDFGGQQIYQTTHQFFLTHRSFYVLVIDTGVDGIGNDDNTLNYWLQALELLCGNSPLFLLRNVKNMRQVNVDFAQKQARFAFLKKEFCVDLDALIPGTIKFNKQQLNEFIHLKEDIITELRRLPLVGFPMPKNWVEIRNQLQNLSISKNYITRKEFIEICIRYEVVEFERQMELSRIFHDLGIFLHFQDYGSLEDFIILQNTWATDAVFAVLDNLKVQNNKGKFSDVDLSLIWKGKYESSVYKKLLALMMKFELCYPVDYATPHTYIIPEMLADNPPKEYEWLQDKDLPLQYRYDFMPKGILTRFIVRMHKYISQYNNIQVVWKTGVEISGTLLDCPYTVAKITEAWNNKQLFINVSGPFAKDLMNKITFQIDELNREYFRQVDNDEQTQKSKWYKMIPCNCITCDDDLNKHFYDYSELLERKSYGKLTIECKKKPYLDVNILELIDGVFPKELIKSKKHIDKLTVNIFLASSSELEKDRERFEMFINRENKRLSEKGIFLRLEIWEDFLDAISQTRLQDEYNKVIIDCDIFVMLYFTKVGKYTGEEFEKAFKRFKETNTPKIYTYFKKADIKSSSINRADVTSLLDFQDKLTELGHFQTVFENDGELHFHFKKQLEKLYDF